MSTTTKAVYVSTSGNNSNPGTLNKPVKTISQASLISTPGTTVYVEGGKYNGGVVLSNSGTASAPIIYTPYGGQKVTIEGTSLPAGEDIVSVYGSYIDFQGFNVQNGPAHGIVVYDTHNDVIAGNSIHGDVSGGIWVGADTPSLSYDNTVQDNTVYANVLENKARTATSGWSQGISANTSQDTIISGNTVYDNYGEGIGSVLGTDTTISGNTVYDNFSCNIYLDNAEDSLVSSNFIYSSGNASFFDKGEPAIGIGAAVESYSTQVPLSSDVIIDNIDVDDKFGFYYGNYGYGGGMQDALIANNSFVDEAAGAIDLGYSSGSYDNIVDNNIFFSSMAKTIAWGNASGFSFAHNVWDGGTASGFAGASDVFGDPDFTAPGGFLPSDYVLLAGSDAIGEGTFLPLTVDNFFGSVRSNIYDAGAI